MTRIEKVNFWPLVIFSCMFAATVLPMSNLKADDNPDTLYQLGPDSMRQEGVPEGKVEKHEWQSTIFEDTIREYYVYIPEQYDGLAPAAVMIFQDGHSYVGEKGSVRVPIVFDNLIHRKEMPVTIGVFVNPGHKGTEQPENRWKGSNRSFEYDTLSDQYARFIHDELLPHVVQQYELNVSSNPDDVAICGASSGGICAFTAAWEHPEWFGKVLSHIGSFTNIRGGNAYPDLIKGAEPKPIRVLLQDGENDLKNQFGDWWQANLAMKEALAEKGYDFKFVGGKGRHSQKHGGAIFPDSVRWLFRDHVINSIDDEGAVKNVTGSNMELDDAFDTLTLPIEADEFKEQLFGYRLMAPANVEEGKTYPLVLFLHGAGERGDDNASQLKYLPASMASAAMRERFPCYVLAPQCYKDSKWVEVDWSEQETHTAPDEPGVMMQMVLKALDKTVSENQVDTDRIYLTGLSMGGYGSWDLASRRPSAFAAVAPICGGADNSRVPLLKDVPMFVVHGDADNAVPVARSRGAVKALKDAGGNVIYLELPDVGHNSWDPAYEDHDGLLPWMFRQKLATAKASSVSPAATSKDE